MRRIQVPKEIEADYTKWCDFLEQEVTFTYHGSEYHTKEHCSRVLLFALLLSHRIGVSEDEKQALCLASVFHDSRRQDDYFDIGHGARAAEYYKEYAAQHGWTFNPYVYDVMWYHDRHDTMGFKAMEGETTGREVLLYKMFKDADALDRFRLGEKWGLDEKYLRTDASRELVTYAKGVWQQYANM